MKSAAHAFAFLGLLALSGFAAGQGTRKIRLPAILGAMIIGCIFGPSIIGLVSHEMLDSTEFVSQLTLGFVAFSIGSELRIAALRRLGPSIITIILSESLIAFGMTVLAVYALTKDLAMALIFGSMAPASAPAGTVAVIQEEKAKGTLTTALYAVVGFDDGLAIFIFAFAGAFARNILLNEVSRDSTSIAEIVSGPMKEIGVSLLLGFLIGIVLTRLVQYFDEDGDLSVVVLASIIFATGIGEIAHGSLILTNLVIGFVIANRVNSTKRRMLSGYIGTVMSFLFILFFALAGAHLRIDALPALGLLGATYIVSRTIGLLFGAWFGATIGGAEEKIRRYLGMGILSQAGVAIGLALIINHQFKELGLPHAKAIGAAVLMTVTATSVFFEIIGPIMTRVALVRSGESRSARSNRGS